MNYIDDSWNIQELVARLPQLANSGYISQVDLAMWHNSLSKEYAHYVALTDVHNSLRPWSQKFSQELESFQRHVHKAFELAQTKLEKLALSQMLHDSNRWKSYVVVK